MTYKFINLDEKQEQRRKIPPEALYFGDDSTIEEQIDGYQTLNTSGRELVGYSVNSQSVNSDGESFTSAYYPKRDITIRYQLEAKSDVEFRQKFDYLNYLLSQKEFEFYFYDDPFYSFTGTVSAVDSFPEGTNSGVSSFTITCSNPFKRRRQATTKTKVQKLEVTENVYFGTVPDLIKLELKHDTNLVDLFNDELKIRLVHDFKAGDVVEIRPLDSEPLKINGATNFTALDITSDLENFEVKKGDVIKVSEQDCVVTLELRGKLL